MMAASKKPAPPVRKAAPKAPAKASSPKTRGNTGSTRVSSVDGPKRIIGSNGDTYISAKYANARGQSVRLSDRPDESGTGRAGFSSRAKATQWRNLAQSYITNEYANHQRPASQKRAASPKRGAK